MQDTLLKKEFDIHRARDTQHPLLEKYGIDARPVAHDDLDLGGAAARPGREPPG